MRDQIQRLIDMTSMPNVTLQIVPFGAVEHAAVGGPFTILRFAEPGLSDVVFLEQLTSALYLDKPTDVDTYMRAMNNLCIAATRPDDTVEFLQKVLAET